MSSGRRSTKAIFCSLLVVGALGAGTPASGADVVTTTIRIADSSGGFAGRLPSQRFGEGVANIGDIDGDGVSDLAVGTVGRQTWILLMTPAGTVRTQVELPIGGSTVFNGVSVAGIGDVDGDLVPDVAVGDPENLAAGFKAGSITVFLLNRDGSVKASQEINNEEGDLGDVIPSFSHFGTSLAGMARDEHGRRRIAVGAPKSGGGIVWLLTLRPDGTVAEYSVIDENLGGPAPILDPGDQFGTSVASIGDADGDGIGDLAVGAAGDDDLIRDAGAVWLLYLNADGTVRGHRKISGLTGDLRIDRIRPELHFGSAVTSLPRAETDRALILVVGMSGYDNSVQKQGAVWLIALDQSGNKLETKLITSGVNGFKQPLPNNARFGASVAALPGPHGEPVFLAVGQPRAPSGTVWMLGIDCGQGDCNANGLADRCDVDCNNNGVADSCDLDPADPDGDGVVWSDCNGNGIPDHCDLAEMGDCNRNGVPDDCDTPDGNADNFVDDCFASNAVRIAEGVAGFKGTYAPTDLFGFAVAGIGDLNDDGTPDLAVSAPRTADGSYRAGAIWILFLAPDGTVASDAKISKTEGGLQELPDQWELGGALTGVGDLDGDGVEDLAVGEAARATILFLNPDGSVKTQTSLRTRGDGLANIGDLDGDGRDELATSGTGFYPVDSNSVSILFLESDGSERSRQGIREQDILGATGTFGHEVAGIGDLDGDGVPDLAVGQSSWSLYASVWILFLNPDGSPKAYQKISTGIGGFAEVIPPQSGFGLGIAAIGDLDGDGLSEIAVSGPGIDDGAENTGAIWLLFLRPDGTVRGHRRLTQTTGFVGPLSTLDQFGHAITALGDFNGDQVPEFCVGAPASDDPNRAVSHGAAWVVFPNCGPDDCDGDGIGDHCEPDCNQNGIPDDCDIASGYSLDVDLNNTPDECDAFGNCMPLDQPVVDCNENGLADRCDIASGASLDLLPPGGDGIPDDCQADCNANGVPDIGEFTAATDCDSNGVLDECELANGSALDCNGDGVLDQCQGYALLDGFALNFTFDTEDVVRVPNDFQLELFTSGYLTLEARIRAEDVSSARTIFTKGPDSGSDYALGLLDGRLRYGHLDDLDRQLWYTSDLPVIQAGVWHHVAIKHMRSNAEAVLLVDGREVPGQWSQSWRRPVRSSAPIRIGATKRSGAPGHTDAFIGQIDEIRLFKAFRSHGEIRAEMQQTISPDTPGLSAYWRFDEGSGNTLIDLASDHDGTRSGPTWVETIRCVGCQADVTDDQEVNMDDLTLVLLQFGTSGLDLAADIDNDGNVNLNDLASVLADFGRVCGS